MFGFSYYLLLPLARGTNGNGYSSSVPLLPTPLASDTGDVGKGLDIQISANGSYRKMNKDGKAWTARLSHVDGHSLWAKEPADIPRLTEEVPNRSKRMKTLGNAVSPPQVFPILKYIADIETGRCPMGGEEL